VAELGSSVWRAHCAAAGGAAGGLRLSGHQFGGCGGLPGWRRGADASGAQRCRFGHQFLADADPVLHLDGRGAVPHRTGDARHRQLRQSHPRRARAAVRGGHRVRHGVFGDLRFHHRHHRAVGQLAAAADAQTRLPPAAGHGPHHGHRRRGHAHSAIGADRSAGQPGRYLHQWAVDRRPRARRDDGRYVPGLDHLQRLAPTRTGAAVGARPHHRLGALGAVADQRDTAGFDFRDGDRGHVGRLGHAHRISCPWCVGDGDSVRVLPVTDPGRVGPCIDGHGSHHRGDPVHHHRCYHVLANPVVLRGYQRAGVAGQGRRPLAVDGYGRDDRNVVVAGMLCRSGQHDADHSAILHAAGSAFRVGPAMVWRHLPDLYAAGPADASVRYAAVHHAWRGTQGDSHPRNLRRRHALCADGRADGGAGAAVPRLGHRAAGAVAGQVARCWRNASNLAAA